MLEWLSQNIVSIIILLVTVSVLGLLVFGMYKGHKAAVSSGNPGCYGCPNAKKCSGSCHCTGTAGAKRDEKTAE